MELLIKLFIFVVLILVGYFRGMRNRRLHVEALTGEERELRDILIFAARTPDLTIPGPHDPVLVCGNAVIGSDHFRIFLSSLRKFVGGNQPVYEELTNRARRQAIVRMKAAARSAGARMVFNVRYETTQIANNRQGELAQVEVLAYGTVLIPTSADASDRRHHYVPASERDIGETPAYETFKNPHGMISLGLILALAIYVVFESLAAHGSDLLVRYLNGAPWTAFCILSTVVALVTGWTFRHTRLPWSDRIIIGLLFIPVMTFSLYFLGMRLDSATAGDWRDAHFTLQNDLSLKPIDPALPVVRLDSVNDDYWQAQPKGMNVTLRLRHGWLGYQYDAGPIAAKYRAFKARQSPRVGGS